MARAKLDAVGVVVTDLARSVRFYRELGVPFEAGAERSEHDHAEATLGGGVRLLIDTEAGMKVFDRAGRRAVCSCARPRRLRPQGAVERLLGPALRPAA